MPSLRGLDCPKIKVIAEGKDDSWQGNWFVYDDAAHYVFHEHRIPIVAVTSISDGGP